MSIIQAEIYDAFIEAGVSEPKARAAAEVIAQKPQSDELATKTDLKVELKSLELRLIKWMVVVAVAIIGINIATAALLASLIK